MPVDPNGLSALRDALIHFTIIFGSILSLAVDRSIPDNLISEEFHGSIPNWRLAFNEVKAAIPAVATVMDDTPMPSRKRTKRDKNGTKEDGKGIKREFRDITVETS